MDVKEFKDLINEIYAVKIEPNYFDKLKELDFKNQTQTYTVFFTNEFFEKSSTAKKYKDYLSKNTINVNLTAKWTKVNKKENESKSQTLDWSNKLDVATNDTDLINIYSLSNLKFTIDQKQELKQFVEERPHESTTPSSSSSTDQTTPTQPNRTTERR